MVSATAKRAADERRELRLLDAVTAGPKSRRQELRRARRPRQHGCWDHLIVAPLWVSYQANLGTLLRTALAVKVTAVIMPERQEVEVTPAVVRSSAGAAEHLMISRVPNLARAIDELKEAGLWAVGLDVRGGRPYDEADLSGPIALVVGSEGSGLRRLVREHCDLLVHLPMAGPTESLNAAVAGSIALYHVFRSRGPSPIQGTHVE